MTADYNSMLSIEQKKTILQQRISQFVAEAYQHSLNKKTYESVGDSSGIENAEKSIAIIQNAILVHQQELENISQIEVSSSEESFTGIQGATGATGTI